MIHIFLSRQFIGFLVTGGIAAVVNFSSRIVYNLYCSFSTAVILAYITCMVTAFILAKVFVFKKSSQTIHKSVLIFTLVNIVAAAQTWLISMGLDYYVLPSIGVQRYAPELAHAIGVVFPVFTSYIGHKRWSFK